MTFGQFIAILRARWWVAVLVFIVTVGTTVAVSLVLPKKFTAVATVVAMLALLWFLWQHRLPWPMMTYVAAVLALTQSVAVESASSGVRVNALVPGWVATDLTEFLRASDETEQGLLARVPMQRWGTVEELASAALFLASDDAAYVTGQTVVCDGGSFLGL